MFDKKKDFECNDYGMKFDAHVGSTIHSNDHVLKYKRGLGQKWHWGN